MEEKVVLIDGQSAILRIFFKANFVYSESEYRELDKLKRKKELEPEELGDLRILEPIVAYSFYEFEGMDVIPTFPSDRDYPSYPHINKFQYEKMAFEIGNLAIRKEISLAEIWEIKETLPF